MMNFFWWKWKTVNFFCGVRSRVLSRTRYRPPTPVLMDESESESEKVNPFLVLQIWWNLYLLLFRYILKSLHEENVHNKFVMGVKVWTSWRNFQEFSKTPSWREFLKKWCLTCRFCGWNLGKFEDNFFLKKNLKGFLL